MFYLFCRFVGNRNRMNVALTRAKYAMYLVGHFGALEVSFQTVFINHLPHMIKLQQTIKETSQQRYGKSI